MNTVNPEGTERGLCFFTWYWLLRLELGRLDLRRPREPPRLLGPMVTGWLGDQQFLEFVTVLEWKPQ